MTTARSIALEVLERVFFDDAFSHIALSHALDNADLDPRDRNLATELVYGTLARKRTIDAVLSRFVNRPLERLDRPVLLALRLAAYQLLFLDRIPAHAAVDESVELAKRRCGKGAAGFTNGVLRSMLRKKKRWNPWERVDAEKEPARFLGIRHSVPDWLAEMLIDDQGFDDARRIVRAFNERPPLYFRVLDDAPSSLPEGLVVVDAVPGALRADHMTGAIKTAVDEGTLVVQDLGSQLISHFASPEGTDRILDACAGLGGKTLHLAKLAGPHSSVTAVDPLQSKLERLSATADDTALAGRIETKVTDLGNFTPDTGPFELVLVDAPCSGLGVLRRHPETRWRRTPKDIADRARLQRQLLDQSSSHVAPGGLLVYSVCTFTNAEGPRQIETFLKEHPDFHREPPAEGDEIDWSRYTDAHGDLRLSPADHDTDAFYAARLRRQKP